MGLYYLPIVSWLFHRWMNKTIQFNLKHMSLEFQMSLQMWRIEFRKTTNFSTLPLKALDALCKLTNLNNSSWCKIRSRSARLSNLHLCLDWFAWRPLRSRWADGMNLKPGSTRRIFKLNCWPSTRVRAGVWPGEAARTATELDCGLPSRAPGTDWTWMAKLAPVLSGKGL